MQRLLTIILLIVFAAPLVPAQQTELVAIDARAPGTPFPHFWEKIFGSGRAVLALRDDYRKDLEQVKTITNFESVRFHGILNDDVGVYSPAVHFKNPGLVAETVDRAESPYNFSYVDQIYDGLLARHVRPFVELSFMPQQLASDPKAIHPFWYHPNVSPPKDYAQWDALITAFANHLIDRYGIDEVAAWYFEVWNEPNLDFWGGRPNQPTYFTLYDHTARALKAVNPRLIVGGPSTAQAAWVGEFLAHTKANNVPVDFASSHVYGNDTPKVLDPPRELPREKLVCAAVAKVHKEILNSPYPKLPLLFSEYNASFANEPDVTDTVYMGPWLATTISQCDGLTEAMSYWSFSDVFEEQGVVRTPFYGGFGLLAERGLPKPAFNAFAMLHHLGIERLKLAADDVLATRNADGSLAIALWNYAEPYGKWSDYTPPPAVPGPGKTIQLTLAGVAANATVQMWRLDADHGNVLKIFDSMGRPATPSLKQIDELRTAGQLAPPQMVQLVHGTISVTLPPQGLVMLTVAAR